MNYYNLYDTKENVVYRHIRRKEVLAQIGTSKKINLYTYIDTGDMILSRYKIEVDEDILENDSRSDNGYFPQSLLKRWDKTVTELRRKLCLSK